MTIEIDPIRLREELARMRELIANDPKVLAQFDKDGNGVIDGDEWQEVRNLVIRRLEHEAYEAQLASQMAQIDDEQLAEIARMEAAMAEEEFELEPEPEQPKLQTHPSLASNQSNLDFSNVELAFDPREDQIARQQSMADKLYEREVASRYGAGNPSAKVRIGEHGSLADCHELILEQQGGAKQLLGNLARREYVIRDGRGEEIGRVWQKQNEALQNLTVTSLFEYPDLHFFIEDYLTEQTYEVSRSTRIGENSMSVMNPKKRYFVHTEWTLSFLRRKYEIRAYTEGVSYYVRRRALNPFTFDVLDPFDEKIGVMQRGWTGLGFLTMGNLFHISIEKDVSPSVMWGFLATALLADLDSESGSRRAGLDFWNS